MYTYMQMCTWYDINLTCTFVALSFLSENFIIIAVPSTVIQGSSNQTTAVTDTGLHGRTSTDQDPVNRSSYVFIEKRNVLPLIKTTGRISWWEVCQSVGFIVSLFFFPTCVFWTATEPLDRIMWSFNLILLECYIFAPPIFMPHLR